VPQKVFEINFDVLKDKEIAEHAEHVASIMISTGEKTSTGKMETKGVAPKAMLYASAIGRFGLGKETFTVQAIQHIAKQNAMDVRCHQYELRHRGEGRRDERRLVANPGCRLVRPGPQYLVYPGPRKRF